MENFILNTVMILLNIFLGVVNTFGYRNYRKIGSLIALIMNFSAAFFILIITIYELLYLT